MSLSLAAAYYIYVHGKTDGLVHIYEADQCKSRPCLHEKDGELLTALS